MVCSQQNPLNPQLLQILPSPFLFEWKPGFSPRRLVSLKSLSGVGGFVVVCFSSVILIHLELKVGNTSSKAFFLTYSHVTKSNGQFWYLSFLTSSTPHSVDFPSVSLAIPSQSSLLFPSCVSNKVHITVSQGSVLRSPHFRISFPG